MASRRDQLHSYQFMIQRVVAALVMRETDPAQSPFRRAAGAIFAGFMVATLGVAGFMVYGLWKPGGNTEWVKAGAKKPVVLVEEETGAKYVFAGGTLYPAANYTSALLAAGAAGGDPKPISVSRNSLADVPVPRGEMIGIPGAPDSLPHEDKLVNGSWSLCSQPKVNRQGAEEGIETVLAVNIVPYEQQHMAGEKVLLVEDEGSSEKYLVYQGHKFKIVGEDLFFTAVSRRGSWTPLQAGAAWLTSLPEGEDLAPLELSGDGESSSFQDSQVGDVFRVEGLGDSQYYVALKDKPAAITQLQAALLMAKRGQEEPRKLVASNLTNVEPSKEYWPGTGAGAPPESVQMHDVEADQKKATCAVFSAGGAAPKLVFNAKLPISPLEGTPTELRGDNGELWASRVVMRSGTGAFVTTSKTIDSGIPRLSLVADGKVFPLASYDVIKMLGYDPKTTEVGWMPENLVLRLPRGPAMVPEDALRPVPLE